MTNDDNASANSAGYFDANAGGRNFTDNTSGGEQKQNAWFTSINKCNHGFTENVKQWLSENHRLRDRFVSRHGHITKENLGLLNNNECQ